MNCDAVDWENLGTGLNVLKQTPASRLPREARPVAERLWFLEPSQVQGASGWPSALNIATRSHFRIALAPVIAVSRLPMIVLDGRSVNHDLAMEAVWNRRRHW